MPDDTMLALKIVARGEVTSFRHPQTMVGVQLSYEMPPPATIYGHICSAVGDRFAPEGLCWAYHFQYEARFIDYEHTHFFGKNQPKMNPTQRQLLFRPQLTLYLSDISFRDAFIHPRYPVVLGRSQDTMTYMDVSIITLRRDDTAYFDGTLLPIDFSYEGKGIQPIGAMQMPRYIDSHRRVTHAVYRYIPHKAKVHSWKGRADEHVWVDPTSARPSSPDVKRAVIWHTWVDAS